MLISEVLNCSFSQWFDQFSHISIESEIIKLSKEFVDYLLSDGIILPKSSEINLYENIDRWSDDNSDNNDEYDSDHDNQSDDQNTIEFPELEEKMSQVITRFGSVFPKLNWSSCQDSKWINVSGTRCTQLSDIYLLLKSSDHIVHDLTEPFKFCDDFNEQSAPSIQYELILRKWVDINPSMEFRCFIANNTIIGITQRDVRSYYHHIGQQKEDIIIDIKRFFVHNIKEKFFDKDYVYRPNSGRVLLIDINSFGQLTDSLLFDWDELNAIRDDNNLEEEPQFRYLTNETGIQAQSYVMNSLPVEVNYGYNLHDIINNGIIER